MTFFYHAQCKRLAFGEYTSPHPAPLPHPHLVKPLGHSLTGFELKLDSCEGSQAFLFIIIIIVIILLSILVFELFGSDFSIKVNILEGLQDRNDEPKSDYLNKPQITFLSLT